MPFVFEVVIAWLYSHLLEYFLHKHLLHDNKRKKWFKTHFGEHHWSARKRLMLDPKYFGTPSVTGDPEIKGLVVLGLLHAPIAFFWPFAYATLILCSISYYFQHRWMHTSWDYARHNASWHYDHHMGPDSNKNWGVRSDIFDRLLRTREVYKGHPIEIIKYRNYEFRGYYAVRPHGNKRRRYKEVD